MTFLQVIFRGLLRRPVRTGLTLLGIAVGVAAVIALVGLSSGFVSSWSDGMESRGTDIVINNMRGSFTPKSFPAETRDRIVSMPGVVATAPSLVNLTSVETSDVMIVSGREWGSFIWGHLKLLSGRLPQDGTERAVVLGKVAAEVLAKKVGDPLQLEAEELTVVGIVDGGALVENSSIILSMELLQQVTSDQGKISAIDVRLAPGTSEEEMHRLRDEMSRLIPEAHAEAAAEHIRDTQSFKMINAMSWGTSLMAVLVGVFGVMNTMLMTMFERKQEIAVLLALGWQRARIVWMVIWESALLGLMGGAVGVGLGVLGVQLLRRAPAIRGMFQPELSVGLTLTAVAIACMVGILSGLYPAWRSSRLSPSMALQGS